MPVTNRAFTLLVGIMATIMIGWVLHVGASILQPLVIALLVASMLQPVVGALARWHIPAGVTVVALISLLFFGLVRIGVLIQQNIMSFVGNLPASCVI